MPSKTPQTDPRVDAYIAKAAPFARPILTFIRKAVHTACPDVEETVKWGMPFFIHGKILGNMAAFKAHCAFGFWKGRGEGTGREQDAMGQFGRLATLADLPPEKLFIARIKKVAALNARNAESAAPPKPRPAPKKEPAAPADLKALLARNQKARTGFEGLSSSQRREYIEWIMEAKREETRAKRLATTMEQASAGKDLNWKYK